PAANAELALLIEVAATPTPGNVDREREYPDLRFEQFLAGAVGAREGLERAAAGDPLGESFETAVAGMSRQRAGNTQFGCLLLLVPLVAAAAGVEESVRAVCESTTVEDAVNFYRAFDHVDVAVDDPPEGMEPLDVRRGAAAVPTVRDRQVTLWDVLSDAAPHDGNAREWAEGFPRTFDAAASIVADEGPVTDRVARVFLDLLAAEPDTLIETKHGRETAERVTRRAEEIDSPEAASEWAAALVADGINPGTTADVTAAATFVALQRGVSV
ncbi:MAG: triphosphoribosyl-dephospho-CoA synthase, partial [Halobaculum sp.]